MTAFQVATFMGIPLTILVVGVVLIALARPDADDGVYAAYLALAGLLSLYLLLIALVGLGESVGQHVVIGDATSRPDFGGVSGATTYFSLVSEGGATAIAAFATLGVLMGASLAFHTRRRAELLSSTPVDASASRVDHAFRAAVCFAMVTLVAIGALVAGASGYQFFHQPIAGDDRMRDLAMGSLLSYGGLVLVAGLIFRANVWAIRGNDETPDDDLTVAEMGDA